MRRGGHGLVVDYLTGVDVVCVSRHGRASLVRARKGDPETGRLLWAHTGGGGGNFGIVTAYYFTGLPNPPEQVRVAITTWPWSGLTAADSATPPAPARASLTVRSCSSSELPEQERLTFHGGQIVSRSRGKPVILGDLSSRLPA